MDHPRRCGEHLGGIVQSSENWGSSPQMRGALWIGLIAGVVLGIIPADAGSTSTSDTDATSFQDHPRRCGEHSF